MNELTNKYYRYINEQKYLNKQIMIDKLQNLDDSAFYIKLHLLVRCYTLSMWLLMHLKGRFSSGLEGTSAIK